MEGEYLYKGHAITEKALKDRKFAKWFHQQMGYVFQNADTQLFCGSVEEEIAFGPVQMGLSDAEVHERTEDCLKLFGIEKLRERPPYHLSGGEKRKVSLACIISLNPEVLILDEPTNGLDPSGIHEIRNLIKSLPALYDCTVLISSHMLSEIELMADDIGILNHGRLLFEGELDELRHYALQRDFSADHLEDMFLSMIEQDNLSRKQRAKL